MKLMFLGADHEVTGSCHYIEACGKSILLDCGMEQGKDVYENQPIPVAPGEIDWVLATHAHIDHTGMLPLLVRNGFRGNIYATNPTVELCGIMLRDSAHIQEFEAQWRNRKNKRAGKAPFEPLYTTEDAMAVMEHFVPCDYMKEIEVCEGVKIRFTDVGHLLGSSSIEIWLTENGVSKKIVFSGDIGNINQPIIHDPRYTTEADFVIMESTYGDRYHTAPPDYVAELAGQIQQTFDRGGNLVIPSFAVGRTQEMLYFIRKIKADGLVSNHADFPVYVDSPLAVEATGIFKQNERTCFDEEAMELVRQGINPITFPGLRLAITSDESKAINFDETPKVIISASGMCDAGRVRHHLKHNLWRPECTILFVGYQSIGTPGRALIDGVKEMRLFGETVDVNAQIRVLTGISGHADKNGLIDWIEGFETKPKKVFIVHGEDLVTMSFADCLKDEHGIDAFAPYSGTVFNLTTETFEKITEPVAVKKKTAEASGGQSSAYNRLVAAGQRLMALIGHCKGMANKDLAKFADQINSLCDKWN